MEAYSQDLRERIVHGVEAGIPKTEVARRFSVSVAAVSAYVRRKKMWGTLASARMHRGRTARIGRDQEDALVAQLEAAADAALAEHVTRWAKDHHVMMHVATMARAITRVGWTFKKGAGSQRTR
jgi:transposase